MNSKPSSQKQMLHSLVEHPEARGTPGHAHWTSQGTLSTLSGQGHLLLTPTNSEVEVKGGKKKRHLLPSHRGAWLELKLVRPQMEQREASI